MRRHVARFLPLAALAAGCSDPVPPGPPSITVHAPADLAPGARLAADDLVRDLARVAGRAVARTDAPTPPCADHEVHVAVLGHAHADGATPSPPLGAQEYTIREARCGTDGRRVVLRGGSLLAGQWAVYDLLARLGVRYFHPEQTYYPATLRWPSERLEVAARPAFQRRSFSVHRTHPVELLAPLDPAGIDMAAHQRRWIDWNVRVRTTHVNGWDERFVGSYPWTRGFPRQGGFNLLNSQQGGRPILDPDDPRPESEQIAAAIEREMAPRAGAPPVTTFGFQFNPSEFTEVDDQETVRRLTYIANYFAMRHPDVALWTINHGTHGEPTAHHRVRFFDLPQFAPPNLGVEVHTLMFYDLERPAPVYGNESFAHTLAWTRREARVRRIMHYPESSWWLTFDLPVPLYLAPVTLEARQHDVDLLRDLVVSDPASRTGVYGHHLFTSGQEWGYWLVDWCFAGMSWDLGYTHQRCLEDFTGALAEGETLRAVLREVERRQVTDMRDPTILALLVGSDDATETAFDAGIVFHPLPPAPAAVVGWDDARSATFEARGLAPLRAMARDYAAWADRVEAALPRQSPDQAPWVREVRDGLRVFGLRAEHAVAVYEAALTMRAAVRSGDAAMLATARQGVERAEAITTRAREVVARREADYRYPAALTTAGDEPGAPGALPNGTVYPYRYLSRTHRMFYWTRPDRQLRALVEAGVEPVGVERRILRETESLAVTLRVTAPRDVVVDWGDGTTATALAPHRYAAQGIYAWTLDAAHAGGRVMWRDDAAVVARRVVFRKGSLRIAEPMGAALLNSMLPGFEVGLGRDTRDFMALGRIDGEQPVSARGSLLRRDRDGLASPASDLALSLRNVGDVTVYGASLAVAEGGGTMDRRLTIRGELATDQVIQLIVRVGGFDEPGARRVVASILGHSPMSLPPRVAFRIEGTGREE